MTKFKAACLHSGLVVLLLSGNAMAQSPSEWHYGIGTGLQRLNAEGDVGFTALGEPRYADLDLEPDDFDDLMDSAFGFQAFAANSQWNISITYGTLTLQDKGIIEVPGGEIGPLNASFEQDITFAEATVAYKFAETGNHRWSVLGGVRNTEHEYDVRIRTEVGAAIRKIDQDWTDVLVGLTHSYPFSATVMWHNSVVTGFGDSDSYYAFHTAINWQFAGSWNAGVYLDYKMIDFENDSPGDPDWYLYDVDEFGPGISIAYIF